MEKTRDELWYDYLAEVATPEGFQENAISFEEWLHIKAKTVNDMKTPDKIYIPNDIKVTAAALPTNGIQEGDAEYIRKDALIEWAKDHQEGERQGSYTWSCYQIILDKLNEM